MEKVRTLDEIIEIATQVAKGTDLTEDQTQDLYVYCIEKFNIGKLQNKAIYQSIYQAAQRIKKSESEIKDISEESLDSINISYIINIDYIESKYILDEIFNSSLLTSREKDILYKIFYQDYLIKTIANEYNLTRERIKQIEAKALRKIRRSKTKKLSDLYDLHN